MSDKKYNHFETNHIDNMVKGWFIGNFEPSLFKTNDVEVAVKYYSKDTDELHEDMHYHKEATEFTVIVYGCLKINGVEYRKGDIIVQHPYTSCQAEVIEDTATTVVKLPGANDDKYMGTPDPSEIPKG